MKQAGPFPAQDGAAPKALLGLARLLLAAASLIIAYGAFAPAGHAPSLMPWDKAEHFSAFFGLMALSLVSFPKTPIWSLAAVLSAVGGLVELVQGLPMVHRDCDWKDWAADVLGLCAVIGIVIAAKVRRSLSAADLP